MRNQRMVDYIFYVLLIIMVIVISFPIMYAVIVSLNDSKAIAKGFIDFMNLDTTNFISAFNTVPLTQYLLNSLQVSMVVMAAQLIICTLAAYAFVFIPFKGKKLIFALTISTMMVPWQVTLIPNYLTIIKFGLVNDTFGLILPFMVNALGIFLIRQHFMTIPTELYEASMLDGCSHFRFYGQIVLPVSKPVLATWGVQSFLQMWNMYLWPLLVINKPEKRTVQIGLKMLMTQEAANNWGMIMAGVVLVITPSLLILFIGQKYLKDGMMTGAVKG